MGIDEAVDHIEAAARHGTEAQLSADGGVMPPTVHILMEDLDQPYVGYLTCRSFDRGADASRAIAELGELPSVLAATRLVVIYEAQDLMVALGGPVDPDGSALVVLDATFEQHTIRWRPYRLRSGGWLRGGGVAVEWGPVEVQRGLAVPFAIARLLMVWRELRLGDLDESLRRSEPSAPVPSAGHQRAGHHG
ncbi:MAG: hypothetical protein LC775_00820 [Acidobacteria bacterium]|nr:hypothetical protein [Acidobacteriota bacterium]